MAKYTITEACHVSIVLEGKSVEFDFEAGDTELDQPVAELLIAQGLATDVTAAKTSTRKTSAAEVVAEPVTEPIQE